MEHLIDLRKLDSYTLGMGAHRATDGVCVMELVSVLAGLGKTDQPSCTNEAITSVAISINDRMDDASRQQLKVLVPRLMRAKRTSVDNRVNARLALWAARSVLQFIASSTDRNEVGEMLEAAERCLQGETSATACLNCPVVRVQRLWGGYMADFNNCVAPGAVFQSAIAAHSSVLESRQEGWVDSQTVLSYALTAATNAAYIMSDASGEKAVLWLSDLLDAHEKAMAEEGVLLEDGYWNFLAFDVDVDSPR